MQYPSLNSSKAETAASDFCLVPMLRQYSLSTSSRASRTTPRARNGRYPSIIARFPSIRLSRLDPQMWPVQVLVRQFLVGFGEVVFEIVGAELPEMAFEHLACLIRPRVDDFLQIRNDH